MEYISAERLCALMDARGEIALLDVRETGQFCAGHILYSVSAPLGSLELKMGALVPRRTAPVVLVDDGEGLAALAATRLAAWGYASVAVLDGGLAAYRRTGRQLFSGVYVPNKAFGEYVEQQCHTPSVSSDTLADWMRQGRKLVLLDVRPYEEFTQFTIPGAVNCPGVDLPLKAFSLAPDERTAIVVNCAGRTRGIIAAQTLIDCGMRNPVAALENGTAGWYLSGRPLAEGEQAVAPPPTAEGLSAAAEAAQSLAQRHGVAEIDWPAWQALAADPGRTAYLFDVRTPPEFEHGHLAGSRNAPGGQLIQSTEHYAGVRGARIGLIDDNCIRARITASWLVRMNAFEVFVIGGGLAAAGQPLHRGAAGVAPACAVPQVAALPVHEAAALTGRGATVLDFADSLAYRRGHIPGAWLCVRSRLADCLRQAGGDGPLIVTSGSETLSRFAAADAGAAAAGKRAVYVLEGGTPAWRAAGLPLAAGPERMASPPDDVWHSPYDVDDRIAAMNDYIAWELGLVAQLERHGGVPFFDAPAGGAA